MIAMIAAHHAKIARWYAETGRAPLLPVCLGCCRSDVRISLGGTGGAWLCWQCRDVERLHALWEAREDAAYQEREYAIYQQWEDAAYQAREERQS